MLHAGMIPAIVVAGELRQPQVVTVLHHRFGPGTAHGSAESHEFLDLPGGRLCKAWIFIDDDVGGRL